MLLNLHYNSQTATSRERGGYTLLLSVDEVYKAIQLISQSCLGQLFLHSYRITVSCNSKHLFLSCLPIRRLRWLCSMYFILSPRLGLPATQTLSYQVGGRHIKPENIWGLCLHPSHSVMSGQSKAHGHERLGKYMLPIERYSYLKMEQVSKDLIPVI